MRRQNLFRMLLGSALVVLLAALPACAGEKMEVVETESGFYYTVQEGDTLWGLSQRFSDSPWQWPDLWKENEQLGNPHLIYPGDRIRLYLKKDLDKYAVAKPKIKQIVKQDPRLPPPYFYYPAIDRVGYLKASAAESSGTIFKIQGDQFKTLVEKGDTVYIKPGGTGTFSDGDQYSVYKVKQLVVGPDKKRDVVSQYYLLGIVEIMEMREGFALGEVIQSFREIKMGDFLMPYTPRSPKIPLTVSPDSLYGKILSAEEERGLIGPDHIVFIDKGSADGVEPGQMFSVTYEEKGKLNPKDKHEQVLQEVFFGDLIVLHVEAQTATAVVLRSNDSIQPGTTVRSPR